LTGRSRDRLTGTIKGIFVQISMQLSYSGGFKEAADTVAELERAGLDLVWVAEAYGFDGASLMGYIAAKTETVQIASGILPIYTRTPTLLAMTAAGVDASWVSVPRARRSSRGGTA
jgi:alkanesulfonate monooxygenase SsuD/methylene tetrahydromethanopterin reductase-like flavin-dependent oxidoreductase (luciferase family)